MRRLAVALAALALVAGCGTKTADDHDASEALVDYLAAVDDGNCDAVKKVVVDPDSVDCDEVSSSSGLYGDELGSLTAKVTDEVDDSAVVTVTWSDDSTDDYDLQRVDGTWLVITPSSGEDSD